MRIRLLKGRLRPGRMALGVSVGLMVGRQVTKRMAAGTEKEAAAQQQEMGYVPASLERRRKVLRAINGILNAL